MLSSMRSGRNGTKGMTKETCPFNPRLGCDCGANPPRRFEVVCLGGMTSLREIPDQDRVPLKDKLFDEITTYAPFKWLGSRRLTPEELERVHAGS